MQRGSRSFVLCSASVGGALAVAAAAAGLMAARSDGTPLASASGLSLVVVFAAGVAAVARPRHIETLTVATILVGMALISELYGRLGILYAPGLILMAAGIARADDAVARRRAVAKQRRAAPVAPGIDRSARLSEQERTILQPRLQPPARRVG